MEEIITKGDCNKGLKQRHYGGNYHNRTIEI